MAMESYKYSPTCSYRYQFASSIPTEIEIYSAADYYLQTVFEISEHVTISYFCPDFGYLFGDFHIKK